MYPKDRRYTQQHEWLLIDGNTATVGITEYAQQELGDVVFVELPGKGTQVKRGDILGTVESVKAASEIYAPVSGTVIESNPDLEQKPETVNQDAHGGGWFCKLELSVPGELEDLLDAEAYQKLVEP